MPLGNGDVGVNVWTEGNGDLVFYISKTDSWGDNSRLLKLGRVRVRPALKGAVAREGFRQALELREGAVSVRYAAGGEEVRLRIWVDANRGVIYVESECGRAMGVDVSVELWRTERRELESLVFSDINWDHAKADKKHVPTIVEPDTVLKDQKGRIGWYHHNVKSVGPEVTMRVQGLTGYGLKDPILHRTFGAVIAGEGARRVDDTTLRFGPARRQRVSVYVLTEQPASPEQWLGSMERLIGSVEATAFEKRVEEHRKWWREFWDRSWIFVSGDATSAPAVVGVNGHDVRIGVDQHGNNRLKGQIGRVSVYARGFSEGEIAALAGTARDQLGATRAGVLYARLEGHPDVIDGSKGWDFGGGLTVEAWVRPEQMGHGGGRIVDKITPGVDDGFLLDTWPSNGLRLITQAGTIGADNVLRAGKWSHVAATADEGGLTLYVDGKRIARKPIEAGTDAFVVTRGYILQRFINACAGRGAYPIKFNGTIFTVDHEGNPDYRLWGPGYWWQNTRLPYISMCASGDFDLMGALFSMYAGEVFEVSKYRTRHYFGHAGAYYPECIYFWGAVFNESYGWTPYEEREDKLQESGWHKWEWVSGPEFVWMMLDYYEHTLDEGFLREKVLPVAAEVLAFFENWYETGADGKLVMHPSQAVETWWDCTNPMPEVAGLRAVAGRLLGLPERLTSAKQRQWLRDYVEKLPELPTREADGVRMLAPAERFADKRNIENPELYAVFPFRLVSFEKDNAGLGVEALKRRWDRGHFGWRQDDIFMAYLGLAEEAKANLVARARSKDAGSRFPAFWGPNYDWVPDQDHGGVLLKALQAMLMQSEGEKIFLLPAWPKGWDADFKLHAPYNTTVSGRVAGGRLVELEVVPAARRKDVVVMGAADRGSETAAGLPAEGEPGAFMGEARLEMQQVFKGDRFGNVVVATDGTVLAFWNGVKVRRSEDGGKTWGDEILVGKGFMSGGMTVDEKTGDILAFMEERHPPAEIFVYRSSDHGRTWALQETVIHPDSNGNAPSMHMNEHGITLRHGEHKGRLLRPSRWYGGTNERGNWPASYTNAIYSDDGGRTWRTSDPFPANGTGEGTVAELSDGRIYYNSRRHWAPEGVNALRRWTAYSEDGGRTWKDLALCEVLPDGDQDRTYGLMGGLVRLPVRGRDVLLFSNIESEKGRRNGHVWASFDGGRTWPIKRQVFEGSFAYSSLNAGRPGTASEGWIYLLFEGGPKGGGTMARFNLGWVLGGEKTGDGEVPGWAVQP